MTGRLLGVAAAAALACAGCDYEDYVPPSVGAAPASFEELFGELAERSGGDPCLTEEGVRALVLERRCTNGACHDAERPRAALDLSSPGIFDRVAGRTSVHGACRDQPVLVAGAPEAGMFVRKLIGATPGCGEPMPPDAPLAPAELQCVARWIQASGE